LFAHFIEISYLIIRYRQALAGRRAAEAAALAPAPAAAPAAAAAAAAAAPASAVAAAPAAPVAAAAAAAAVTAPAPAAVAAAVAVRGVVFSGDQRCGRRGGTAAAAAVALLRVKVHLDYNVISDFQFKNDCFKL
jgi:hypothetical protein